MNIVELSQGVPGAAAALLAIQEVDKFFGVSAVEASGLRGSDIWDEYKKTGQDAKKFYERCCELAGSNSD